MEWKDGWNYKHFDDFSSTLSLIDDGTFGVILIGLYPF